MWNPRRADGFYHRASEPPMRVSGAEPGLKGLWDRLCRWRESLDREHGSPVRREPVGALLLTRRRESREVVHRVAHRFPHRFVVQPTRICWTPCPPLLRSSRALGVERQTKHGAPAGSNLPGLLICAPYPCEGRGPARLRQEPFLLRAKSEPPLKLQLASGSRLRRDTRDSPAPPPPAPAASTGPAADICCRWRS